MYLTTGTILNNRYRIDAVIGQGGFGITYLALDQVLNVRVAVKEYLPQQAATRSEGQSRVTVYSGEAGQYFEYGLKKFLEEAQSVARFANHPNIVSARDYFEANGTAYMVMEYIEGQTLKQFLDQKGGKIPFELAKQIMLPVMDALRQVHGAGLLHRDISPDNIYLTTDGQVKLLDFGAARYFAGEQSKSLSIILKAGYAPEEQYRSRGKQGAWTDVYAVAATTYRAITGVTPPEALDRKEEDTLQLPSRIGAAISPVEEQVLLKALAVKAPQRFQSMGEFQEALHNGMSGASPLTQAPAKAAITKPQPPAVPLSAGPVSWIPPAGPVAGRKSSATTMAVIFSMVAVLLVLGGGAAVWHFASKSYQASAIRGTATPPEKTVIPATPEGSKTSSITATPRKPDSPRQPADKPTTPNTASADELIHQGGKYPATSVDLRREVETISEKIRSAHLNKDINKWLSCYSSSYPNLGQRENEMLRLWKDYDIKDVSYRISNVQRLSDAQASADIVWNIQVYDHRSQDYTLVRQSFRMILENGAGGWTIRNSQEEAGGSQSSAASTSVQPPGATTGPRWPWTSQRPVREDDLANLSREELLIMRNEIYARHGMVFRQPELRQYFQKQSWYHPRGTLENQQKFIKQLWAELNSTEKNNIQFIIKYARKAGRI